MPYLDFNASTPLDPRVLEAMRLVEDEHGNPASTQHFAGQRASKILEDSRDIVANLLGCGTQDLIFTSGSTESAAIAILGTVLGMPSDRRNVVTVTTEHHAILSACETAVSLAQSELRVIGVDADGIVNSADLADKFDKSVAVVAVMLANNETGVIQPLRAIADLAHQVGAIVVCDITQAVGKMRFDLEALGIDVAFFSGHKIYGPKGTGALIVPRRLQKQLLPILGGGGQERGLRGGTQNLVSIRGFAKALALSFEALDISIQNSSELAAGLVDALREANVNFTVVAEDAPRISNTVNIRVIGHDAEALMAGMPEVEVSTGSACNSANPEPSHVLLAMGMQRDEASQCIRFSFGRSSSMVDVEGATNQLKQAISFLAGESEMVLS